MSETPSSSSPAAPHALLRTGWLTPLLIAAGSAGALGVHAWTGNLWLAAGFAMATAAGSLAWGRSGREGGESPLEGLVARIAAGDAEAISDTRWAEAGNAGAALRSLVASEGALGRKIQGFALHLDRLPAELGRVNESVEANGSAIEEAVEETASLLAHINESIRGINAEVDSLSRSSEEATSSILEMGSSIDEVARSAGSLHDAADASTSSVHEISASIRQVAQSTDAVQSMAEESAAAMVEMDRTVQEMSQHAAEAAQLTERVSAGAAEGTRAVGATIDGIAEIRRQTVEAREVLQRLADRIGEIGAIVTVIGGINEETNLLSLNAAIIAAQAGEQGKAFAVVASHVKTLAQRTASSTKEIQQLIGAVQDESANAVNAMGGGMEAVETGVERSRKAGGELQTILESSQEASQRVAEIARATDEQSRNSKHVAEAAQQTSSMVQQITTAMSEQSRASETMLQNAERSLGLCSQVHRSTEEQRETSRFITESMSAISEMVRSIQANTESHSAASELVSSAVSRILEIAQAGGTGSRELMSELMTLQEEARALANAGPGEAEDAPRPGA
jgi:methyl-accepting chemotaxis protein